MASWWGEEKKSNRNWRENTREEASWSGLLGLGIGWWWWWCHDGCALRNLFRVCELVVDRSGGFWCSPWSLIDHYAVGYCIGHCIGHDRMYRVTLVRALATVQLG